MAKRQYGTILITYQATDDSVEGLFATVKHVVNAVDSHIFLNKDKGDFIKIAFHDSTELKMR